MTSTLCPTGIFSAPRHELPPRRAREDAYFQQGAIKFPWGVSISTAVSGIFILERLDYTEAAHAALNTGEVSGPQPSLRHGR